MNASSAACRSSRSRSRKLEAEGRPVPPQPATRPDGWWVYDPLVPAPVRPLEDAERLLRAFLPQAFRRPVAEELLRYYVKLVHAALDKGVSFAEAMVIGYQAALCSPHFLFLTERIEESRGRSPYRTGRLRHCLATLVFPVVVDAGPRADGARGKG